MMQLRQQEWVKQSTSRPDAFAFKCMILQNPVMPGFVVFGRNPEVHTDL